MSSTDCETNEETGIRIGQDEKCAAITDAAMQSAISSINDKLGNLSCPWNWDMGCRYIIEDEKILSAATSEQFQKVVGRQEYFPEQVLLYHLMLAYEATVKDDLPSAMECINQAEQSLVEIIQQGTLRNVERVLQYLITGTKCFVLVELGQLPEMIKLLKAICDVNDMNEIELAMLNGCQCSILIMSNTTESSQKMDCAKRAIEYDPGNGKWHFLLGEICRTQRRANGLSGKPDAQETSAHEEAYRLSPNVLFGVTLAQMYRESRNFDLAMKIYKEVSALQPTSCLIRFQLALGFIRGHECVLAKECLDYIAEKMPDSIRYAHYMGIYEEMCNNDLVAALPHYERATELCNYSAEWQYVECRKRVEPDWDPLPHMLNALEKYKSRPDNISRDINIQIGLYYIFKMHDILSACQYLVKAIKIDPDAKILRHTTRLFDKSDRVNVYHVLVKEVQFALQNATIYDDDQIAVLKSTLELCRKNCRDSAPSSVSPWGQRPSSRFSSSNRNYEQSSSSRVQVNWREERSDPSSLGFSKNYPPRRSNDAFDSPKRYTGSSHERDYTSWRSGERKTPDSQDKRQSSNTFDNKRNSASTNRVGGRDAQQTLSSQQRSRNAVSGADAATCSLVKTDRDLNL